MLCVEVRHVSLEGLVLGVIHFPHFLQHLRSQSIKQK